MPSRGQSRMCLTIRLLCCRSRLAHTCDTDAGQGCEPSACAVGHRMSTIYAGPGSTRPHAAHNGPAITTNLTSRAKYRLQSRSWGAGASCRSWQQPSTRRAAAAAPGGRVCAHGVWHGTELQPRGRAGVPGCHGGWATAQAQLRPCCGSMRLTSECAWVMLMPRHVHLNCSWGPALRQCACGRHNTLHILMSACAMSRVIQS
jgi:hypothetical protein